MVMQPSVQPAILATLMVLQGPKQIVLLQILPIAKFTRISPHVQHATMVSSVMVLPHVPLALLTVPFVLVVLHVQHVVLDIPDLQIAVIVFLHMQTAKLLMLTLPLRAQPAMLVTTCPTQQHAPSVERTAQTVEQPHPLVCAPPASL
jgi:hypothetical protein